MNLTFESKDRIRVKENGFTGTVIATVTFHTPKEDLLYHIKWDHFPGMCQYMASDVGDLWEKVANIKAEQNLHLPPGIQWIPLEIDINNVKVACDHKWVNASLLFEKMVCYHCGVDKP
jgi:hypothetical protein